MKIFKYIVAFFKIVLLLSIVFGLGVSNSKVVVTRHHFPVNTETDHVLLSEFFFGFPGDYGFRVVSVFEVDFANIRECESK